jgi:hypothetical protein
LGPEFGAAPAAGARSATLTLLDNESTPSPIALSGTPRD